MITDEKTRVLFFQACEAVAHCFKHLKEIEHFDSDKFMTTFFGEVRRINPDKNEQTDIVKIGQSILEDFYDIQFLTANELGRPLH
ncbi:hypothetical protein NBRC116494_06990 [Aurantivibrio plasticivorans]